MFTLFNAIVGGCFLVLLLLGRWQDALFGLAAFANAIIGCVQEFRAKAKLDRLALLNAPRARVRRDGVELEIAPAEVVQDDILVLRAGDQVPADAVVAQGRALQIDESMLTGESDAVDKSHGDEALSGSVVVAGEGDAQVTRVGADSYANKFADEAKRFSIVSSELRTSIDRVLTWVGWGIGPIGLLVLNAQMMVAGGWVQAWESGTWVQAVVNTIASLTAMIPLGLVLVTSIAFAVGAAKLAGRQVLVNELPAVEGLARVDVICLDKTGTLTGGDIRFDGSHPLSGEAAGWQGALAWYGAAPDANATARCLREPFPAGAAAAVDAYVPFSSARKWSAVSFSDARRDVGARRPRDGVRGCRVGSLRRARPDGHSAGVDRTPHPRPRSLAGRSDRERRRRRAPARRCRPGGRADVPRAGATGCRADARRTSRRRGSASGSSRATTRARWRRSPVRWVSTSPRASTRASSPRTTPSSATSSRRNQVFGRVTPEQKKRMVVALQGRGHVVAMTGDGVNDALAIKTADIGIAMNSGAAATKAVARLVLLDGQFSHLPDVVAEGRQVIANIERVSMLFLTKTAYATGLAILFGLLVLEFPFLPRQLSITDGLTIGIPAFFLALMPNTQRYVPGFLKRSLSFAIPAGVIIAIALTLYTLGAMQLGVEEAQLRTGSTIILAIVGIWVLTVLSRPINRYKALVIGAMFIALVVIFTVPLSTEFFQLVDPGEECAWLVAVVTVMTIGAIEVVRFFHRRYVRRAARVGCSVRSRRRNSATRAASRPRCRRRRTGGSATIEAQSQVSAVTIVTTCSTSWAAR